MNVRQFQSWLNQKGEALTVDGKFGPLSEAATLRVFSNRNAPAVTPAEISAFAQRLNVPERQLRAVALVETKGKPFDDLGRPKILYERHYFWRQTNGAHPLSDINQSKSGGYGKESAQWPKLLRAIAMNPAAAFASCSWGRFQVMGANATKLAFANPIEMAYSCVQSEAAHYELLVRYVQYFGLKGAMRAISTRPADNERFALGYNGPQGVNNGYHVKLAEAMK